jgi:hypothetical protein
LAIKTRGVEVGVAPFLGQGEELDCTGRAIDPGDRVLPTFNDPGGTVGRNDHAVGCRSRTKRDQIRFPGPGIEPVEFAAREHRKGAHFRFRLPRGRRRYGSIGRPASAGCPSHRDRRYARCADGGTVAAAADAPAYLGAWCIGSSAIHYNALGADDAYVIADLPDNSTAAALGIAVSAAGLVRTRTTALLTVEETDRALEKTVNYRAPGR